MVVEATTNMSRPRYRRWACFMLLWRTQNDFSGGANPYFAGSEWRSREAGSAPTPLPISSALSVTWPCNWNCCFVFTAEIASTHNKEQCNIHPEGMGGLESFCTLSLALPTSRLLMLLRRGLEKTHFRPKSLMRAVQSKWQFLGNSSTEPTTEKYKSNSLLLLRRGQFRLGIIMLCSTSVLTFWGICFHWKYNEWSSSPSAHFLIKKHFTFVWLTFFETFFLF
jgi:hypothetical protein